MAQDKILSLLGLAAKAGKLVSGEFMTERAVKSGQACLVVVAADASANTKKMFLNMCSFYHVPIMEYGQKEVLGHAIGRQFRASLAVTDEGLARSVQEKKAAQTTE